MEDARNLLINYVGTAADIDLILDNYDLVTADEAIKSGVNQFNKKFIAIGSDKRNAVLTNLAKKKLANAKKSDLWTLATLATTATLQDVVNSILDELRPPEINEGQELTEVETELVAAAEESAVTTEEGVESHTPPVQEEKEEDQTNEKEVSQVIEQSESTTQETIKSKEEISVEKLPQVGVCTYGVPIIPVVRITPNVFGLKESLMSDLTKEDLQDFFNLVKSKVTPNAKE